MFSFSGNASEDMKVGPPRPLPPFVLALISIILLALVALMITVFYRAFSQSQSRLPLRSDAREVLSSPYSHVNARWERGQTNAMEWPNFGARDLFNLRTDAGPDERGLARTLQPPEASVTRGTVVVFFQDAYTGLHHQFSVNNYPSTRVLGRWLPRSYPVDNNDFTHSMA
ncbi:hypothetical protein ARMGADRAFT_1010636 [Armillaria gallica]|uniref:Uncharacterized protein n=1 Tax=Armillaria gallica TaxID=47427 RepID=A0A2H3DNQ5_ARMGA|nr:hypothetical protein ARMGADRAFT_1010636 [Armillaria gallica]